MPTWRELEDADMEDHPTGWAFVWAVLNLVVVGILLVSVIGVCWFANYYITK